MKVKYESDRRCERESLLVTAASQKGLYSLRRHMDIESERDMLLEYCF